MWLKLLLEKNHTNLKSKIVLQIVLEKSYFRLIRKSFNSKMSFKIYKIIFVTSWNFIYRRLI